MARPSKPAAVLKEEGKSHRTKKELAQREKGEAALLSGKRCCERKRVKADPAAHAEYQRVIKLMWAIGKDDALYSSVINRYCELFSETEFYKTEIADASTEMRALHALSQRVTVAADVLTEQLEQFGDTEEIAAVCGVLRDVLAQVDELLTHRGRILKQISDMDLKVKQKREMMLAIEKETCMTVSAALRTVPKETDKSENNDDLMKILQE